MTDSNMETTNKKRLRIGIIFNFRKSWMGGLIYIVNLINALNFLEEEDKPEIIVFYNRELEELTKEMQYPYLKLLPWEFKEIYKGYYSSWLKRKNVFIDDFIKDFELDGIYPVNDRPVKSSNGIRRKAKIVAWIPDLQHKFYPHFLGKKRNFLRELRIKILLKNTDDLVVSSNDVKSHFRKFYSLKKDLRIHILQFVSIIKDTNFSSIETLCEQYKVPREYFMVCNQFTNHKNHFVILHALALLKSRGEKVHFVFTGKMEFRGNDEYIKSIREIVAENELEACVSFLDVIPRQDQLSLMKHAKAIVQPSFFEGWSTVIEDAICLQLPVIAADLPVNIEQLGDKGTFFNPDDEKQLADILVSFPTHDGTDIYEKYDKRIEQYGKKFLEIFNRD